MTNVRRTRITVKIDGGRRMHPNTRGPLFLCAGAAPRATSCQHVLVDLQLDPEGSPVVASSRRANGPGLAASASFRNPSTPASVHAPKSSEETPMPLVGVDDGQEEGDAI